MYRVSDVLKPDFARSWHEAVAIVQEVASQLVPGGTVPAADDLLIDAEGAIQLGFGPDSPQNAVHALGSLLNSLLDGVEAPGGFLFQHPQRVDQGLRHFAPVPHALGAGRERPAERGLRLMRKAENE